VRRGAVIWNTHGLGGEGGQGRTARWEAVRSVNTGGGVRSADGGGEVPSAEGERDKSV
jgi:hypothetical protein